VGAMKQGLSLRVSQHISLTPQLQQSIRLLQLSTLELNQEVEQMLDDNPFLELSEEQAEREDFGLLHADTPLSTGEIESGAAVYTLFDYTGTTAAETKNGDEATPLSADDGISWEGDGTTEMSPDDGEWATPRPAPTIWGMTSTQMPPSWPARKSRYKAICIAKPCICAWGLSTKQHCGF
jgi:RNA polymerase sigma-54 factor